MCLTTKQLEPFKSENEITCYKVLRKNAFTLYQTPFQGDIVPLGVIRGKKPFIAEGEEQMKREYGFNLIKCGFIHTYTSEQIAKDEAFFIKKKCGGKYDIFECKIPANEPYFVSDDNREYCSKSIKFVKKVEYVEY